MQCIHHKWILMDTTEWLFPCTIVPQLLLDAALPSWSWLPVYTQSLAGADVECNVWNVQPPPQVELSLSLLFEPWGSLTVLQPSPHIWRMEIEKKTTLHCIFKLRNVAHSCTSNTLCLFYDTILFIVIVIRLNHYNISIGTASNLWNKDFQFPSILYSVTHPSAFSHGSAGLLNKWSAQPPPLLILGARDPQEYIWWDSKEI